MPGEVVSSEDVFKGKRVSLRLDVLRFASGDRRREVVVHPGAAAAVPALESGEVLLVRQYRHAVGTSLYEVPAGTLERGEGPEDCIRRELMEEVGFRAKSLEKLLTIATSPGVMTERISIYLARGEQVASQNLEPGEEIQAAKMTMEEALETVGSSDIVDAKSFVALVAASRRLAAGDSGEEVR